MRRITTFGIALFSLALIAGCDSGSDDERSESELIVGDWRMTEVRDDEGDRTQVVSALGAVTASFRADRTYDLVFDPSASGASNQELSSTYTVIEATNTLTLNVINPITQQPLPLGLEYRFENDDEMVLTVPEGVVTLVAAAGFTLFGDLAGDVRLTLEREN